MTTRLYREADRPALERMAAASGFPYCELTDPLVESVIVVVDDADQLILGVASRRIPELYAWMDKDRPTLIKLAALRKAHDAMAHELRAKGYSEATAFLPPRICKKFGERLVRIFGWKPNWNSFAVHF